MGLLDFKLPDMNSAEGQGLLAASLSLMGAQKMPGQRGAFGSALADAGMRYMDTRNSSADRLHNQELKRLELDAYKRKVKQDEQMRQAAQGAYRSPEMANAMSQGPMPDGSNMPTVQPGFDIEKYQQSLYGIDPMEAIDFQAKRNKQDPLISVPQGGTLYNQKTGNSVFTSPPKAEGVPNKVQEFQYAKENGYKGTFAEYVTLGPTIMAGAVAPLRQAQIDNIVDENNYNLPPPRPRHVTPTGVSVTAGGRTYTFPDQKSANNFKLKAGVK